MVGLLRYEELPAWRQDNKDIHSGYRPVMPSLGSCLGSVFGYLHNETVNIHTHLWGALVFLILLLRLEPPTSFVPLGRTLHPGASPLSWHDTAVFGCFFLSGLACLAFSTLYHTLTCHSHKVSATFARLDYIGIVWLIVGSFYPSVYYGFYCHTRTITFYLTLITLLGAYATYTVISPAYRTEEGRRKRTLVFIGLGLTGVFPIGHGIYQFGLSADRVGLDWLLTSGLFYISGAVLYAGRLPERYHPGKYDLIGSSHQLFHVLVLMAAACHYFSVLRAFQSAHSGTYKYCAHGTY